MNNYRRQNIKNIIEEVSSLTVYTDKKKLTSIIDDIVVILVDEQVAFENMPENFRHTVRGKESANAQKHLEYAIDTIEAYINWYSSLNAKSNINNKKKEALISTIITTLEKAIHGFP